MKHLNLPRSLPVLTEMQREQLLSFQELALGFNAKLNLYSEASAAQFWERHILHSLALAVHPYPSGGQVVDWGTGGGLPGIPLAVLFPDVSFTLVDAVAKKVRAVQTVARRLGLENVAVWHGRAERWEGAVTHSVSRATAPLATLWEWHEHVEVAGPEAEAEGVPGGLYCLKGGDLEDEIAALTRHRPEITVIQRSLADLLPDPYFETKKLVRVTANR